MMRLGLAALCCVATWLPGCADDPTTIVELTVTETIPVDFGSMSGGVPESASVSLADLRDEPAYADNVALLRCSGLDLDASGITVTGLTVAAGATMLSLTVEVAPAGTANWTPLGTFNGSIVAGEAIAMSDARATVLPTGVAVVSDVVLGASPALAVRVQAQVPGDLEALQVSLALSLAFSSEPKGCPSAVTGG